MMRRRKLFEDILDDIEARSVNFLCKMWVAKTFSNKSEQKEAYIRMLNGIDLKNKLKRKDKE